MPDIQTDISRVAAGLDAAFPDLAPIVLYATGQEGHIERGVISSLFADYGGHIHCKGAVIERAQASFRLRGYEFRWHEGAKMAYATSGSAKGLSAHERVGLGRIQ